MAESKVAQCRLNAYVYAIVVDGIDRYIGKGTGNRADSHFRIALRLIRQSRVGDKVKRSAFYQNLAAAIIDGAEVRSRIIVDGISDSDAFSREIIEIAARPTEQLWNYASGGNGLNSDQLRQIWADKVRRLQLSETMKRVWMENPRLRSARFSERNAREKQSEMLRDKWADPCYRSMQVAAHSRPRIALRGAKVPALSAPARKRWAKQEFREKAIKAMKVAGQDPERRRKISQRLKAQWATPEFREKMALARATRLS